MIKINKIVTNSMGENVYIVYKEGSSECIVIDPGDDLGRIEAQIEKLSLTPTHILLTHGHFDHIGAVEGIKKRWGSKVYIHEAESDALTDSSVNLSVLVGGNLELSPADGLFTGDSVMQAAGMYIKAMHTPGHSTGGMSFLIEDNLFTGDLLFYMSIGRTDFKDGNMNILLDSVRKLKKLPQDTKVFPGHGIATSLGFEFENNPFLEGI